MDGFLRSLLRLPGVDLGGDERRLPLDSVEELLAPEGSLSAITESLDK